MPIELNGLMMFIDVYVCLWMSMNVYECLWMFNYGCLIMDVYCLWMFVVDWHSLPRRCLQLACACSLLQRGHQELPGPAKFRDLSVVKVTGAAKERATTAWNLQWLFRNIQNMSGLFHNIPYGSIWFIYGLSVFTCIERDTTIALLVHDDITWWGYF